MKKFLILLIVFFPFLYSCADTGELYGNFWAHNYTTNKRYRIQAELLAEGEHCNIWVESYSAGNVAMAQMAKDVAEEFDQEILVKIKAIFDYSLSENGVNFDPISYADYLGDRDGKLCILLLNINSSQSGSSVAGYFWENDLLKGNYSNMRDMIYINITSKETMYTTIAHELQHLMNHVTSIVNRSTNMDIWIDEGLSLSAEWYYTGKHLQETQWYIRNGSGYESSLIDRGNNFYVWGNRTDEYADALLDDYATVYLFFQWLRLQSSNGTGIYKDIITSKYSDYQAVTEAAANRINIAYKDNWALLLGDWLEANYKNDSYGLYGYKDNDDLKGIKPHFLLETEEYYPLFPGEGVFSSAPVSLPGNNGNIRYKNLTNTSNGNALLSYNVNVLENGARESATITGKTP